MSHFFNRHKKIGGKLTDTIFMSSCTQLVKLIERYGFKEIENDLNWLKELEEKGRLKDIFPNLKLK